MRLFISRFKGSEDYLRAKVSFKSCPSPYSTIEPEHLFISSWNISRSLCSNMYIIEELLKDKEVYNCFLCIADSDLAVKP